MAISIIVFSVVLSGVAFYFRKYLAGSILVIIALLCILGMVLGKKK